MDLDLEPLNPENSEPTNDVVTVSMLQIALRAEVRRLQAVLNDLGTTADTATPEGRFEVLQQIAGLLLDHSRYWTHVRAISQTVLSLETAENLYNRLSLQERSKFSVEALTNLNGTVTQRQTGGENSSGDPAYIVVTLLLGTADDRPLFDEIYSASLLRDTLSDIRMMQSRYLLVFETLWSPQDPNDSLTEAELAAEYPDLVGIA